MIVINRERISYFELIIIMMIGKIVWSAYNLADPIVQRPLTTWPVMTLIALLGYFALLLSKKSEIPGLWDSGVTKVQRFVIPVGLGILFGLLQIGLVLSQNINVPMVPFPLSIPVYMSVGILSELILHYIPLVGIRYIITLIIGDGGVRKTAFWFILIFISVWEPVLQLTMMIRLELLNSTVAGILPFLLVWTANLLPLILLKKYGLLAAVSWRLADYLVWHILWGALAPVLTASWGF